MSGASTAGRSIRLAEIRVLTCNVQRASVSRACRQVDWLVGSDADVLVLTEVSAEESGDVLARLLADDGFGVLLPGPSANDRYVCSSPAGTLSRPASMWGLAGWDIGVSPRG